MRHARANGQLQVYYNGVFAPFLSKNVSLTYFDNVWAYILLQRKGGTVTLYGAVTGDTTAANWGSFTYTNQIDQNIDFGCSDQINESMYGFMDAIEVGLDKALTDPTVIPTSAPT